MNALETVAPAMAPRAARDVRVLVVGAGRVLGEIAGPRFAEALEPGDLVVVNDAATLPASIPVRTAHGEELEVRLAGPIDPSAEADAVLLGSGDWRTPTEKRPAPPAVARGEVLRGGDLALEVRSVAGRRVRVRLAGDRARALAALWSVGRPVQYAYVPAPLALWDVQNAWAAEPWAVEMPSAARLVDFAVLSSLRARGIAVATVTHAAGLSDVGSPPIDAFLPFPERSRVTSATMRAVRETRARGGRVVAIGTSVVRALETAARAGDVFDGTTDLRIGPGTALLATSALVTGVHAAGTSHHALLAAFASSEVLAEAMRASVARGLLGHEHGDVWLVWR